MSSILIGTFSVDGQGFSGNIRTLKLRLAVRLVPLNLFDAGERTPDFQVVTGKDEYILGGAWKQRTANDHYYLKMDDPSFPHPLKCRLVKQKNSETWLLFWERNN